jgi:coenzyme PQQ biosynthesis protein PqqD
LPKKEEALMGTKLKFDFIYTQSENVAARDIHGEFIIIPITSGVGDLEDEIFTLNETGKAIWDRMDGKRSLRDIVKDLGSEFEEDIKDIEKDVLGFTQELFKRKMIVMVTKRY